MDPIETFFTGIAPEHYPAFFALLLLPPAVWIGLKWLRARPPGAGWASRLRDRWQAASYAGRVTALLLLTTGVIHLALPLGHRGTPFLNLMFLASGVAFTVLAAQSLGEGKWRLRAALLLIGSIAAYLVVAGSGWQEEPDQIGIVTKLVELAALGLIAIPGRATAHGFRRRLARPAASLAVVSLTVITGLVIWVGSFVAHSNVDAAGVEPHEHEAGTPVHAHADDGHSHTSAARAQAGVIMRPLDEETPTLEQVEAADRLAAETRIAAARYEDYDAAIADGYAPDGPQLGAQRHLRNKANQHDGRVLDPSRPELLVYGTDGERHLLLGVVYQMEKAGEPGPAIGGPITNWHAHNVCVTLTPPGFGLVSPFGGCPLGAVAVTIAEMMHVWIVDNPGGPFAENLDDAWVRGLLAQDAAQARE